MVSSILIIATAALVVFILWYVDMRTQQRRRPKEGDTPSRPSPTGHRAPVRPRGPFLNSPPPKCDPLLPTGVRAPRVPPRPSLSAGNAKELEEPECEPVVVDLDPIVEPVDRVGDLRIFMGNMERPITLWDAVVQYRETLVRVPASSPWFVLNRAWHLLQRAVFIADSPAYCAADALVECREEASDLESTPKHVAGAAAPTLLEATHYLRLALTEAVKEARVRAEQRSEERRVGKECRSRWSPYH